MTNNSFAKRIKEREAEQLRSASAQRLIEKLSLLRNRRDSARKRWFWELLQNASDYNDSVNVRLTVDKKKVVFEHDGHPFIDTDVFNLIRPDSNKKNDNRRKDNIGKFGSGFVSTHILSSHVNVKGIVDDEDGESYGFEVDLDRSRFDNKFLLMEDIDKSIDQFATSVKAIAPEKGYNTSFTYYIGEYLPGIKGIESADIDLDYLYRLLPYTLCFMPKILSVQIIDKREGTNEFRIKPSDKSDEDYLIFNITKNDSPIEEYKMKMFKRGDVSSCFRVKDGKIMSLPRDISMMFCGLPLVGTERTGLPLIVNSLAFEPTTEREGVEIDPECDKQNISLLNLFVDLYDEILDFVEENELLNAFEIVGLSEEYNGLFESKEKFKDVFVEKFADIILNHAIVQNFNGEFINVSDVRIPLVKNKASKELYDLAKLLIANTLPKDYSGWQRNLKYFGELSYSYNDLAESVQNRENISSFGKNSKDAKAWLKVCLRFLIEQNKDICSKYKILPNQMGDLRKEDNLYLDKRLPAQLKRINEQTEKTLLASALMDSFFNKIINLEEYTTKDLANRIDENIKEIYRKNGGGLPEEYVSSVNSLYSWTKECGENEDTLTSYFPWFFLKRASLIADMMTEEEREQSLRIVRSGKMEQLSALAESDISNEDIKSIVDNIDVVRSFLSQNKNIVDDKEYADKEEGDYGENIVWLELQKEYPLDEGYKVIWASRDYHESRFDFRIEKDGEIVCYCDAKTTSRGLDNADSIPFFIRKSQWLFLKDLADDIPYYLARVFKSDNNRVRYLRVLYKKE